MQFKNNSLCRKLISRQGPLMNVNSHAIGPFLQLRSLTAVSQASFTPRARVRLVIHRGGLVHEFLVGSVLGPELLAFLLALLRCLRPYFGLEILKVTRVVKVSDTE